MGWGNALKIRTCIHVRQWFLDRGDPRPLEGVVPGAFMHVLIEGAITSLQVVNAVAIRRQRPFRAATAGDDNLIVFHQGDAISPHITYVCPSQFIPPSQAFPFGTIRYAPPPPSAPHHRLVLVTVLSWPSVADAQNSPRAADDPYAHKVRPGRPVRAERGPLCERRIRRQGFPVRRQGRRDPRRVLRGPLRHRSESSQARALPAQFAEACTLWR
jgi:hypothetical protein